MPLACHKSIAAAIEYSEAMDLAIVKTDVPMTASLCDETILALAETYPFLHSEVLTTTAYGRPVRTLVMGTGNRHVLYSAAHHANEWITTPVLLKFAEDPPPLRLGCGACASTGDSPSAGRSTR